MEKFILATKQHMTRVFDASGVAHAATVLATAPLTVTQVKTQEKDGYRALQVGMGSRKEKNVAKAQQSKGLFARMREFRTNAEDMPDVGSTIDVSVFAVGDVITVSGISKAKGFQGVVKRHNFSGGPGSHGQKHTLRSPGSIGGGLRTRVPKGMRMAGRMGGTRTTVKNLKVLVVDAKKHELVVEGAVPGRRGTVIEVRGA